MAVPSQASPNAGTQLVTWARAFHSRKSAIRSLDPSLDDDDDGGDDDDGDDDGDDGDDSD